MAQEGEASMEHFHDSSAGHFDRNSGNCPNPRAAAHHDPLTGYLNYEGFKREAQALLRQNPGLRYSVWYADIKRFKYINGVCGYEAGDCLLRFWARLLREDTREGETFCRVRADTMACLRFYEHEGELVGRFSALLTKLADFSGRTDKRYAVELSCGVYLLDPEGPALGLDQMMDRAGIAQKSVKDRSGSNLAFFTQELWKKQVWELEITQNLHSSLENGAFSVWFQPQYNYASGKLVGAEALVRWAHPHLGPVSPGDFIPALEKNGLISQLDEYVWDQTLGHIRRWKEGAGEKPLLPVSVNISRLDIQNPGLCELLLELLGKHGLEPSALRLEITESAYARNPELLIETTRRLRRSGFFVEMDDFGSGYSSLNVLQDVQVDAIKLDLGFLAREMVSGRSGIILSSIVRMAHWLRLPIIAEGVESRAQADYLISIGCDLMQGNFFHSPMPAADFEALIAKAPVDYGKKQHLRRGDFLNIGSFLDPGGATPLIFSHCIGPAAVYEYVGGNLEALFVNDQYYQALGISREDFAPWRTRVLERYDEADRKTVQDAIATAIGEGYAVFRLYVTDFTDPRRQWWLRVQMRHLSVNDNRHLLFLLFDGAPSA